MVDNPELELLRQVADVREIGGPELDIDALISKGWAYQDFPRMLPEFWQSIKTGLGQEGVHYYMLTEAHYGDAMRGQLLISPEGRENLLAYCENNPLPADG